MKVDAVALNGLLWLWACAVAAASVPSPSSSSLAASASEEEARVRELVSEAPPSLPSGISDPKPRLVQGNQSDPTRRSFFARAGYDSYPQTSEILCGATLVSRDIAISAAHCQGAFNYGIRVLDATTGDFTRLVPVAQQHRHPKWDEDRDSLNFDILVLKLETPLAADDVAKPIPFNLDPNYPADGQRVMALGYGITEEETVSPYLREAEMQYITNDECWGRSIQFNNVQRGDEVMCTDPVAGSSTCLGDSGGPLTDVDGTKLLGLVSFGSGCQADELPDGYCRMSAMADWVREQICELSEFAPSDCPAVGRNSFEVHMRLHFQHDFWSDETTYAVRERTTREIVFAGPTKTPERGADEIEEFFLVPGDYTFEVWDTDGSGLLSKGQGRDGSWYLTALYDQSSETRVAEGGADFGHEQYTDFTVISSSRPEPAVQDQPLKESSPVNPAMEACMMEKDAEEIAGNLLGTYCQCSELGVITCRNGSGQVCQRKNQSCSTDADCCNQRDCRANICRQGETSVNRDDSRLGRNGGVGGAAGRQGGNLRRGL